MDRLLISNLLQLELWNMLETGVPTEDFTSSVCWSEIMENILLLNEAHRLRSLWLKYQVHVGLTYFVAFQLGKELCRPGVEW